MFERVIMISGAPRSGTSWVGQILDSSPETAYRFQPLFSWAFKNDINHHSTKQECEEFFKKIYNSNDPFLLQTERKQKGLYPCFTEKKPSPPVLVIKMVRYHYLLNMLLDYFKDILQVVFIVRHPGGVINSWLKNSKEFYKEADPFSEWDLAESRNKGKPEEYWGFDGWRRSLDIYSSLQARFPRNIYLIRYELLVSETVQQVFDLFSFLNLKLSQQTTNFLLESTQTNHNDPYSVYKSNQVKDKWKTELDPTIKAAVLKKLDQLPYRKLFY